MVKPTSLGDEGLQGLRALGRKWHSLRDHRISKRGAAWGTPRLLPSHWTRVCPLPLWKGARDSHLTLMASSVNVVHPVRADRRELRCKAEPTLHLSSSDRPLGLLTLPPVLLPLQALVALSGSLETLDLHCLPAVTPAGLQVVTQLPRVCLVRVSECGLVGKAACRELTMALAAGGRDVAVEHETSALVAVTLADEFREPNQVEGWSLTQWLGL